MIIENLEIEYKCLVSLSDYQKIVNHFASEIKTITQINTYYQDLDNNISKLKGTLRKREFSNTSIFTLKIPSKKGLLEYEVETTDIENEELNKLLNKYQLSQPLKVIGQLKTIRRKVILAQGELCLDENHYNNKIDYEIEYECTEKHDGKKAFITILKELDINYTENLISKYLRATS
ncbi:MAG: CYTH domain-containing protein [Erysipelotrichaceae bacterium]